MSKFSYKGLGVALVSLAMPLVMVAPVAAADPGPDETSAVELACLGAGFDVSTCTGALTEGVFEVVEGGVNADLGAQGISTTVDLGLPEGSEPADFPADINAIAVNPLPPLPPAPLAPMVPAVPFQ